jgi:hypothetical protein
MGVTDKNSVVFRGKKYFERDRDTLIHAVYKAGMALKSSRNYATSSNSQYTLEIAWRHKDQWVITSGIGKTIWDSFCEAFALYNLQRKFKR